LDDVKSNEPNVLKSLVLVAIPFNNWNWVSSRTGFKDRQIRQIDARLITFEIFDIVGQGPLGHFHVDKVYLDYPREPAMSQNPDDILRSSIFAD